MKIVILGGYGTFGGRLVELLLGEPRLDIVVAGRSIEAARAFCSRRTGAARLIPMALGRLSAAHQLGEVKPDLVVDASGPFQAYGEDPYSLVRAALAAGADYIDLADGAAFVSGISALDELARGSGHFALSGMSSFPVLTAAVVRRLAAGRDDVDTIIAGIAPSPYAGVGRNVIKAIASYAGKPVAVLEEGLWRPRHGFIDSRRLTVNVPGEVPLPPIRFALTDVPDLKVLPGEWPALRTMWMGAGPTPALLHRLLWLAARLVQWRLLPSLVPLAPVMDWVVNRVRWGEHRGGMMVEVTSSSGDARSWHLLAEGDGGPLIPSMAAEAIILRCLDGSRPASGARPGHGDLELADYEPLLARHGIRTGVRASPAGQPLYEKIMGEAFGRLAPPLRHLHAFKSTQTMRGKAEVSRGTSLLSRLAARLFGFPQAGRDIDVEVEISAKDGVETWTRNFAGRKFHSIQRPGRGWQDGLIVEGFGPLAFGMAVVERGSRLQLVLRNWTLFGMPLPRWAMPVSRASEHGDRERFNFDVEIGLPVFGRMVHYRGWLMPSAPP